MSTTQAGGTGIFVTQLYNPINRTDLNFNIEGECEASFIEIQCNEGSGKNVLIGSLYRHPHDNFDEFFNEFSKVIEKVNKKYSLIILGDLNFNTGDNTCTNINAYKNLLLSLGLRNLINLPTRVTESSETIIDHAITNLNPTTIESGIIQDDISDHFPIFANAKLAIRTPNLQSHHFRRKFSYTKKDKFVNTLKLRLGTCQHFPNDPISELEQLISTIQLTANQIFPAVNKEKDTNVPG